MKSVIRHAFVAVSLMLAVLVVIVWSLDVGSYKVDSLGYRWAVPSHALCKTQWPAVEWDSRSVALVWTTSTATTEDAARRLERPGENNPFGWVRNAEDGGVRDSNVLHDFEPVDWEWHHDHRVRASIAVDEWRIRAPSLILLLTFGVGPASAACRWASRRWKSRRSE
jgi:hypothetical protein